MKDTLPLKEGSPRSNNMMSSTDQGNVRGPGIANAERLRPLLLQDSHPNGVPKRDTLSKNDIEIKI
jgi:hypothetical protein